MLGEKLHEFDQQLGEHVLASIRAHFSDPGFVQYVEEDVNPAVLAYLQLLREADRHPEPRLLLSDDELDDLHLVFLSEDFKFDRDCLTNEQLYRRSIDCVSEIREHLAKQYAEEWATNCARFADLLRWRKLPDVSAELNEQTESQELDEDDASSDPDSFDGSENRDEYRSLPNLSSGIAVVRDWIADVRRLLRAMGAVHYLPHPEGPYPTPTYPTSSTACPQEQASIDQDQANEDVQRMRKAIAEHSEGKDAKAAVLINKAEISNKRGRDALRTLEALGEYTGFGRSRPPRYGPPTEGTSNSSAS